MPPNKRDDSIEDLSDDDPFDDDREHDMAAVKSLCVYCGASDGADAVYRQAAVELGTRLAESGIELVYGGGRIGLMGRLADAARLAGSRVTGIIPAHLHDREIGHHGISELIVVGSMHERKQLMFERSDAFAVLPGGIGTIEEAFEIITWKQLRLHDKPIVLVDIAGYWRPLQALVDHVIARGFASPQVRRLFQVVDSIDGLMAALAASHEPNLAAQPDLV
jgi:uncharacterized protein (TIGR00730 family)